MTKISTLSAVMMFSAAVASPVFAQDEAGVPGPGSRYGLEPQAGPTPHIRAEDNYRGAQNQLNGPSYTTPETQEDKRNIEDFGFSGRDPSRVGGEDPSLNPPD